MIRVELSDELKLTLRKLLHQVSEEGQHVILTIDGIDKVALIPMGDLDLLHAIEDEIDGAMADEVQAADAASGEQPVSLEDLKKELHI